MIFVYAAVGVHPDEVGSLNENTFSRLRQLAVSHPKVVAIGEIGLDYYWEEEPREVQKQWFLRQMELARELSLPIAVHSREAARDTFDLISGYGRDLPGVLHCYSYSPEMAQEYVKLGYYIGLGGVVTFKTRKRRRKRRRSSRWSGSCWRQTVPIWRPRLSGASGTVRFTLIMWRRRFAQLKGISKEEVIAVTEQNARKLFGLA